MDVSHYVQKPSGEILYTVWRDIVYTPTRKRVNENTRNTGDTTRADGSERTVRTAWGCAWRVRVCVWTCGFGAPAATTSSADSLSPCSAAPREAGEAAGRRGAEGCTGELLGEWERRARGGCTCDASAEGVLNRPCEPSPAHRPDRSDATAARNMAIPCIFEICFVRVGMTLSASVKLGTMRRLPWPRRMDDTHHSARI